MSDALPGLGLDAGVSCELECRNPSLGDPHPSCEGPSHICLNPVSQGAAVTARPAG